MVADVDRYQQFVPWCTKSRVLQGRSGDFQAELEIGFPPLVERYTSEVTVIPNHKVRVGLWRAGSAPRSLRALEREDPACFRGRGGIEPSPLSKQAVCSNGSLFRHLETMWRFSSGASDLQPSCKVHFYVRVERKSPLCCCCG